MKYYEDILFDILHYINMFKKGITQIEWSKAIIIPIPKDKKKVCVILLIIEELVFYLYSKTF